MSKPTQSSVIAKIKSARSLSRVLIIFIVLFFAAVLFVWVSKDSQLSTVQIGDRSFVVTIADTDSLRQKGLSGTTQLGVREGMLFVFERGDVHCFWMKNMNYPIDIVWIGENKQVVAVQEAVSPDSYPQQYCPEVAARYVLETASRQSGARVGERVLFAL